MASRNFGKPEIAWIAAFRVDLCENVRDPIRIAINGRVILRIL